MLNRDLGGSALFCPYLLIELLFPQGFARRIGFNEAGRHTPRVFSIDGMVRTTEWECCFLRSF
jgi:hypothetical protein